MVTTLATPFNIWVAGLCVLLLLVDVVLAHVVKLEGASVYLQSWPALLLMLAVIVYCQVRSWTRLLDAGVLAFWGILLSNLLSLLILVAGRSRVPLVDRQLYSIDRELHFSTAAVVHFAAGFPLLRILLAFAYSIAGILVLVTIIVPPLLGKTIASRRFLLAAAFSAMLTAGCFAFWPAAGPWTTEPIDPSAEQARVTSYLQKLKSSDPVQTDVDTTAIVSFPSFHVALAIVVAVGLGSLRWLRLPMWILTILVCLSTLTTGWHYAIDIAGGIVVALVSLVAASWIEGKLRREEEGIHPLAA